MEIKDLKLDSHNFNRGTYEGNALLEHSLRKLKAGRSILIDKDNNIVAGNKTAETADRLGMKLRIIETDGTELIAVRRKDIDINSREGRELAIADNATAQLNLCWDEEQMNDLLPTMEIDPDEWGVDLTNNTPTPESKGEVDVMGFSSDQTLVIKLTARQHAAVMQRLSEIDSDPAQALLQITHYYD